MPYAYSHKYERNISNTPTVRTFLLNPTNGVSAKDSTGRMRVGLYMDTKIHAIQDTGLWYFKPERDSGKLPEKLNQRFTNYNQLVKYLTAYFASRGISVQETH